jgi:hypothetical protein
VARHLHVPLSHKRLHGYDRTTAQRSNAHAACRCGGEVTVKGEVGAYRDEPSAWVDEEGIIALGFLCCISVTDTVFVY